MTDYEKQESLRELIRDGVEALRDPAVRENREFILTTTNMINVARRQLLAIQEGNR